MQIPNYPYFLMRDYTGITHVSSSFCIRMCKGSSAYFHAQFHSINVQRIVRYRSSGDRLIYGVKHQRSWKLSEINSPTISRLVSELKGYK